MQGIIQSREAGKMLKLEKIMENGNYDVEVDFYVPFTIRYQSKEYEDTICWRIGDFNKSLMEFSIGNKSKILKGVTLVAVSKAHLIDDTLNSFESSQIGIPILEISEISRKILYDSPIEFETFLGKGYIKVEFGKDRDVGCEVTMDRIKFRFNKNNELISVIVIDLSDDEYKDLKDGLKL